MKGPSLNKIAPSEIVPRPSGRVVNGLDGGEDNKLNELRAEAASAGGSTSDPSDASAAVPVEKPQDYFHKKLSIALLAAALVLLVFPPFEHWESGMQVSWSLDGSFGRSRWFTNGTGTDSISVEENNIPHFMEVNSILVMLTALVVISITFELGHHHLHHMTAPNFHPVLKALNGELMGLGFIAIVFYVIEVRAMILTSWSVNTICAECDPCQGWNSNDPNYHMDNVGDRRRLGGSVALVGVTCNVDLCGASYNWTQGGPSKGFSYNTTKHGSDSWLQKPAKELEYAHGDKTKTTECDRFHAAARHLLVEWDQESPGWLEQKGGLQPYYHDTYPLLLQLPFAGGTREQIIHAASLAAGLHEDAHKVKTHMLKDKHWQQDPEFAHYSENDVVPNWARAAWAEHRRLGGGSTGGCYHCDEKLKHKFEDIHMIVFLTMILYFVRAAFLIQQVQGQQKRWGLLEANLQYSETRGRGDPENEHGSSSEHEIAQEWYSLMQGTWKLPDVLARQSHIDSFSSMMKSIKRGGAVGLISDVTSTVSHTVSNTLRRGSATGAAADVHRANDHIKSETEHDYKPLFETGTAPKQLSVLRWLNPFWVVKVWRAREALEYSLLRRRFIQALRKNGAIDKAELRHFDFAEYLSIRLGSTTAHIVHIPPKAWLMMEIAFCCFYLVTVLDTQYRMRAYVLALFLLFAFMTIVLVKLYSIRDALLPKIPAWWQSNKNKAFEVDATFIEAIDSAAADPPYRSAKKNGRKDKSASDPHKKLFWCGNMNPKILGHEPGPELITYIIRLANLLCIIWLCLIIYAGPYTANNDNSFLGVLVAAFLVILGVIWVYTPEVLRMLTIVESIELMKKPGIIDVTIRKMKTRRTMNTMVLLRAICMVVRQTRGLVSKDNDAKPSDEQDVVVQELDKSVLESVDDQEDAFLDVYHGLNEEEKARCDQLKEFFMMFDQSGDGEIDITELSNLMRALGVETTADDSKLLMKQFDKSGDGGISFPEFYAYMKGRMDAKDEDTTQIVADIFSIIDLNGDGTITVGEFSKVLLGLPIDISQDDIEGIVQEMDVSGEGEISLQEFAAVLDDHKS